jgi:hypothetical protein
MASSSGSMTPSKDERKPNHLGRVKSREMAFSKIIQKLKTHDTFIPPSPAATCVEVAGVEPPIPDVTAGTNHKTSKLCNRCESMFQNWDQFMEDRCFYPHGQSLMELKAAVKEEDCALCYQFWSSVQNNHKSLVQELDSQPGRFRTQEAFRNKNPHQEAISMGTSFFVTKLIARNFGKGIEAKVRVFPAMHNSKLPCQIKKQFLIVTYKHRLFIIPKPLCLSPPVGLKIVRKHTPSATQS